MEIQTFEKDGNILYALPDICKFLNIKNPSDSIRTMKKEFIFKIKIKRGSSTGIQEINFLNIYGIKNLLSRTRSSKVSDLINILNIDMNTIFSSFEASYIRIIEASFDFCKTEKQFCVDKYKIDIYFTEYKLAIECDEEIVHKNKFEKDYKRQQIIEEILGCKFLRFNPNKKNFNIGNIISQIFKHIREYK
jgi:very-short-patch-repair endonuclease